MDDESVKHFVERSLVNSALRYWQNLASETVATIFETDKNIANIITRVVEVLKLEFCGEGNFFKDPGTTSKYAIALKRLQLCDICEIDIYVFFKIIIITFIIRYQIQLVIYLYSFLRYQTIGDKN